MSKEKIKGVNVMNTCICSSCKNLKSIVAEVDCDENDITEECEFGFPSESCSECVEENCELTCEHYIEDCEEELVDMLECSKCGKPLKVVSNNMEVGQVYCPTCYLNK